MGYFSRDDLEAIAGDDAAQKVDVRQRFAALHKKIFDRLQNNSISLSVLKSGKSVIATRTVCDFNEDKVFTVQYSRSGSKAVNVERLMGREEHASTDNIMIRLHPVIELRLSKAGLAVELILSPDAWWDQQNLKGKLSVSRHRHEFYTMLMELQANYCLGFWQGIHLSDMHLTGKYFQHPRILDEWLSTFHPNSDWFRLGIWYDADDENILEDNIETELAKQIQTLFPVYEYFLWTSDNNFREFVP